MTVNPIGFEYGKASPYQMDKLAEDISKFPGYKTE